MFVWFKQTSYRTLINIDQIVRLAPSSETACTVYLADGQQIYVNHSIDSIEKTLGEAVNPSHGTSFRAVK